MYWTTLHQLLLHKPPNFPERKDRHAVREVDPFGHGQAIEQQRVATLVEIAQYTGRLSIPDRREESIQFARRRPEAVIGQLRCPCHQPRNQVSGRDRCAGIQNLHPEVVLADESARYSHPLELGVGQQGVARGIEQCAKGRVLSLTGEGPAVARPGIDHAHVVQRKRRLVPTVDYYALARIVPPVSLQVGLLRLRKRRKSAGQTVNPVAVVKRLRGHPRVPLILRSMVSITSSILSCRDHVPQRQRESPAC